MRDLYVPSTFLVFWRGLSPKPVLHCLFYCCSPCTLLKFEIVMAKTFEFYKLSQSIQLPSCKRNCLSFLHHHSCYCLSHMSLLTEWLSLLGWLLGGKPQAVKRIIALLSLPVQARERGLPYLPGNCFSMPWDVLKEAGLLCTC